jgi:hypothetical protein
MVIFWLVVPVVFWFYANVLEEHTASIFKGEE